MEVWQVNRDSRSCSPRPSGATLEGWASRRRTAQGLAQRARIVLMCADGMTNKAVAAELGITRETVGRWRDRFVRGPVRRAQR